MRIMILMSNELICIKERRGGLEHKMIDLKCTHVCKDNFLNANL